MAEGKCAIWGTQAKTLDTNINTFLVTFDSPRAGGEYSIDPIARQRIPADTKTKSLLTTWLVDQRISGIKTPVIDQVVLTEVALKRTLLSTSERMEKFFQYCYKYKNRIGSKIFFKYLNNAYSQEINQEKTISDYLLYAYIEIFDEEDTQKFISYLLEIDLINRYCVLSAKAYEKIDALARSNKNSKQAFVAMWFDPSTNHLYEKAIRPAIEDAALVSGIKFQARKIDNKEHNNKIDDEIIAEIRFC